MSHLPLSLIAGSQYVTVMSCLLNHWLTFGLRHHEASNSLRVLLLKFQSHTHVTGDSIQGRQIPLAQVFVLIGKRWRQTYEPKVYLVKELLKKVKAKLLGQLKGSWGVVLLFKNLLKG